VTEFWLGHYAGFDNSRVCKYQPDEDGITRVELQGARAIDKIFGCVFLLPFPFLCLGCCVGLWKGRTSTLEFDRHSKTFRYDSYRGWIKCLRCYSPRHGEVPLSSVRFELRHSAARIREGGDYGPSYAAGYLKVFPGERAPFKLLGLTYLSTCEAECGALEAARQQALA